MANEQVKKNTKESNVKGTKTAKKADNQPKNTAKKKSTTTLLAFISFLVASSTNTFSSIFLVEATDLDVAVLPDFVVLLVVVDFFFAVFLG